MVEMKLWLVIVAAVALVLVAGVVAFFLGVKYRMKVAEAELGSAEEEAKREKVKAVTAMKGEVAEVAVLIASGILDKEITPEENAKIIDDCLKEWDEGND